MSIAPVERQLQGNPYPAYKDSGLPWLGRVPEHWEVKRLKTIARVENGATPSSRIRSYWDGDIPWVTPKDLGAQVYDTVSQTQRSITEAGYRNCGTTLVPEGSIILSTRAPIGHLAIAGVNLCTNQGCRSLRLTGECSSRFLYYSLVASRDELSARGRGTTFQELSSYELGTLPLMVPPTNEQNLVVNFLDSKLAEIDRFIAGKRQLVELLNEQRSVIINQAVTKGIDPNVKLKASGIEWLGEIPEHWDVKRIRYLADVELGKMLQTRQKGPFDLQKPYLRAANVQWSRIDAADVNEMWFSPYETRLYMLKANDIVITEGGEVGRAALWQDELEECYIQNSVHKVTCLPGNHPLFVLHQLYLMGKTGFTSSIVNRVSIAHLTREKLKDVFLPIPPSEEQLAIVCFLDSKLAAVDTTISRAEREIELMNEYRTALISDVVTGKIDVRGAAAEMEA